MKMLMKSSQRGEGTGDRFNRDAALKGDEREDDGWPGERTVAQGRRALREDLDERQREQPHQDDGSAEGHVHHRPEVPFHADRTRCRHQGLLEHVGGRRGGRRSAMGAIFAADGAIMVMRRTVIVFLWRPSNCPHKDPRMTIGRPQTNRRLLCVRPLCGPSSRDSLERRFDIAPARICRT